MTQFWTGGKKDVCGKMKRRVKRKTERGTGGGVGGVPVVTSPWGCWILLEGSTVFLGLHLILAFMHELWGIHPGKKTSTSPKAHALDRGREKDGGRKTQWQLHISLGMVTTARDGGDQISAHLQLRPYQYVLGSIGFAFPSPRCTAAPRASLTWDWATTGAYTQEWWEGSLARNYSREGQALVGLSLGHSQCRNHYSFYGH